MLMTWHGTNFLARVQDVAPTMDEGDTPGTARYFDCDAVAWACTQIGAPVGTDVATELGGTTSWQVRAALELDTDPIGLPDDLPDSE